MSSTTRASRCRSPSRSTQGSGPALYEYRPLVRDFVEARAARLRGREDAVIALEELAREPAAGIYARAHAGRDASENDALFRTVLVDLLLRVAESCGGFDWDDESFDRAYARARALALRRAEAYTAVAPLVGISTGVQRELGVSLRVRAAADGELSRHWPEANGLLPRGFGREADRYCVIELRAALDAGEDVPDAPAEIADVVSAIRLATAAPLAAGPVLFETLDGRPYGIRPCSRSPRPSRRARRPGSTSSAAPLAAELLVRLALADADTNLAEALDRWELSLFQHEPFRSEQLRAALEALLGTTWPLRAAVLLEEGAEARGAAPRSRGARRRGRGELRCGDGRPTSARRGAARRRSIGGRGTARPRAARGRPDAAVA